MPIKVNSVSGINNLFYKNNAIKSQNNTAYVNNTMNDTFVRCNKQKNINFGAKMSNNFQEALFDTCFSMLPDTFPIPTKLLTKTKSLTKILIHEETPERERIKANYNVNDIFVPRAELSDIIQRSTYDLSREINDFYKTNQIIPIENKEQLNELTNYQLLTNKLFNNGVVCRYLTTLFNTEEDKITPEFCSDKIDFFTQNTLNEDFSQFGYAPLSDGQKQSITRMSEYLKKVPPKKLMELYEDTYNHHLLQNGLFIGGVKKSEYFEPTVKHTINVNSYTNPISDKIKPNMVEKIVKYLNKATEGFEIDKNNLVDDSNRIVLFTQIVMNEGFGQRAVAARLKTCYDLFNPEDIYTKLTGYSSEQAHSQGGNAILFFSDQVMGKYIGYLLNQENPNEVPEEQRLYRLTLFNEERPKEIMDQISLDRNMENLIYKLIDKCSKVPPQELLDKYNNDFITLSSAYFENNNNN